MDTEDYPCGERKVIVCVTKIIVLYFVKDENYASVFSLYMYKMVMDLFSLEIWLVLAKC